MQNKNIRWFEIEQGKFIFEKNQFLGMLDKCNTRKKIVRQSLEVIRMTHMSGNHFDSKKIDKFNSKHVTVLINFTQFGCLFIQKTTEQFMKFLRVKVISRQM